jgi:O-antigen ligase
VIRASSGERLIVGLIPVLIGASALCFGAVYPWGYWPLIAAAVVIGAAGVRPSTGLPRQVGIALAIVGVAIAAQLWRLPQEALVRVAPDTDAVLRRYDVAYALSTTGHAVSIEPRLTGIALSFYVAFALLLAGVAGVLSRSASALRRIVGGVAVAGVGLGAIGVVQRATFNGLVLWFWQPLQWQATTAGEPFGPFVNRNHFAGWMLMALPLVLGYCIGRSIEGLRRQRHTLRSVAVWFGSAHAAGVLLLAAASAAMALALALTMSRAGIIGMIGAGAVFMAALSTRTHGAVRVLGMTTLAIMFVVALVQAGTDPVLLRFADAPSSFEARAHIWQVARQLAGRFWLTGTGLNTFGVMTLLVDTDLPQHFSEVHNDYLQLAAEGGLLVGVPLLGLLATVVITIRRRMADAASRGDVVARWIRFGAVIGLGAISVQEMVDFSLQIPANATLFVVVLAIALHQPPQRNRATVSTV